jgi:hypothetical protein
MVIGQVVRGGALSASVSSLEVVYRRKLRKFEQKETKTDEDRGFCSGCEPPRDGVSPEKEEGAPTQ